VNDLSSVVAGLVKGVLVIVETVDYVLMSVMDTFNNFIIDFNNGLLWMAKLMGLKKDQILDPFHL